VEALLTSMQLASHSNATSDNCLPRLTVVMWLLYALIVTAGDAFESPAAAAAAAAQAVADIGRHLLSDSNCTVTATAAAVAALTSSNKGKTDAASSTAISSSKSSEVKPKKERTNSSGSAGSTGAAGATAKTADAKKAATKGVFTCHIYCNSYMVIYVLVL
jgi:hypothetical protein